MYILSAVLIFVVAKAREPGLCAMIGIADCLSKQGQRVRYADTVGGGAP